MRDLLDFLRKNMAWLILISLVNFFYIALIWIIDRESFIRVSFLIFLASLFLYIISSLYIYNKENHKKKSFLDFLEKRDRLTRANLADVLDKTDLELLEKLEEVFDSKDRKIDFYKTGLSDYESYVESWVHEIKTPLSLLTLLVDNHNTELGEKLITKLDYVRLKIMENIDRILTYSRLKNKHKDYILREIDLENSLLRLVDNYKSLLEEKKIDLKFETYGIKALSDRRSLDFILNQIISNAIKYKRQEIDAFIDIKAVKADKVTRLEILDNGQGVKACDLPFIFDKGFTGEKNRQDKKATGLGLFLAEKIGADLGIKLKAESEYGSYFKISLDFPNN